MKLHRDCISCLARILDQVSRNLGRDAALNDEVKRRGLAVLHEAFRPDKCPPWLATRLLEEVARLTGDSDPYEDIRQKEMAAAEEIFKRVRPLYGDDFRSCVELAVLGNNLDFFRDVRDLEATLVKEQGRHLSFAVDHIERTRALLCSPANGTVLFLADNAGEVFFDIPLLEKITSLGVRVVYGVKKNPFINDLTWADLERNGLLPQIPGALSTGTGALLDLPSLSAVFRKELEGCDLVFSKGQANYECLGELPLKKKVFYLLKAKCRPISEALGVPLGSYVALLHDGSEPEGST
ncbi:MAG: DUF89 family protein [Deltaproteobacteria bacterium]|nr:DUF89 family protein [Deltaproteobacteria bacterium]